MLGFGPEEWTAIRLSVRVAVWATVVSLPVGVLVALALARGKFWGKELLNGLVHLPLVLPPVVTGYLRASSPSAWASSGWSVTASTAPAARR